MIKLLASSLLLCSFVSYAQEVELAVQTGHTGSVNCMAMNREGSLLASGGIDKQIVFWDLEVGRQLANVRPLIGEITCLEFSPSGKFLIAAGEDSVLAFISVQNFSVAGMIEMPLCVRDLAVSPDLTYMYLAGSAIFAMEYASVESKFLVNQTTPQVLKWSERETKLFPIQPKTEFTSLDLSEDGKLIAFGGRKEELGYLVDLSLNKISQKYPNSFADVRIDQTNKFVVFTTNQGLLYEVSIGDGRRKSLSSDWMLNYFSAVEVSDQFIYAGNLNGTVKVINRETFAIEKIYATRAVTDLCLNPETGELQVSTSAGKIEIWNTIEHRSQRIFEGKIGAISHLEFSSDGQYLLAVYQDGAMRLTNLITNQSILNTPAQQLELTGLPEWSCYEISSFTNDSASFKFYLKRPAPDQPGHYDKFWEYHLTWIFDQNRIVAQELKELRGPALSYLEKRKQGILADPLSLFNFSYEGLYDIGAFPVSYKGEFITGAAFNSVYDFWAVSTTEGLINFYNGTSGNFMVTMGAFRDGQYILLNDQGYYLCSKRALENIGFRRAGKLYSFEQYDVVYNRPDKIVSILPYYDKDIVAAYQKAYEKRVSKLGDFRLDESLEMTDLPDMSCFWNTSEVNTNSRLKISVRCTDAEQLSALHVFVNGVPDYGTEGKSISGNRYVDTLNIELSPGSNYIQLFCTNQRGYKSHQLTYTVSAPKSGEKQDLYFIAIGVSAYLQSQYDLDYARKDAEDLVRYFNKPFGAFETVHTKLLVDSSVTIASVRDLHAYVQSADVEDVVIVFVAGHGILDDNYDYYFATYETDFENPQESALPFHELEMLMSKTKSRNKVLLIDACHSGELDKDEVIETDIVPEEQGDIKFRSSAFKLLVQSGNSLDLAKTLFADMRLSNGTTIISSSGATEFAIEGDTWKNGVFTYCLLQGLLKNKADLNNDRIIYLSELQEYLLQEVSLLTKGHQTPTSRMENLNNDFRLK